MTEPRIIPAAEARELLTMAQGFEVTVDRETLLHYAYTAAVLGEQREAALACHRKSEGVRDAPYWTGPDVHWCEDCDDGWPCPTARALGVTA